MKKFLLILLLLLIVGGGGGYYYFFILAAEDEMAEPAPPPPPDNRFVEMKSLRIPVMRSGVVVNYVVLHLTLETVGADKEELALSLLPRLRNAFLTDLHGYFATVPVEDRLMVKALKRRLLIISNRVLGPGTVKEVLVQKAFKQKG